MSRLRFAAPLAAVLALTALPAAAQTVGDYRAAVAAVPAPATEAACRPVENFVVIAIPDWELKPNWNIAALPFDFKSADPELARKWQECQDRRLQSVVNFGDGSGQQILTPPGLEDPNRAYTNTEPRPLPPL